MELFMFMEISAGARTLFTLEKVILLISVRQRREFNSYFRDEGQVYRG